MTRVLQRGVWIAALALALFAAAASARDISTISIGVVPFEHNAPPGEAVPDVETLLADRIGTLGVKKVVGPTEFGVTTAAAEPDDVTLRGWAAGASVDAVVAGRITRIGTRVSVDVRLRSGATGAVAGTYVAEIASPDQLDSVVDRLAQQILQGAEPLAPAAPPVAAPAAPGTDGSNASFNIPFDSGRPLSIRSDELESSRSGETRKLIFIRNVVVTQDDVTIESNRLEAIYPPGTSQPSQMVATGQVRMIDGGDEARCDQATYERAKDLLICRGNAELREGSDCVTGDWIEFDLKADTVKVGGGATVVLGGSVAPANEACR